MIWLLIAIDIAGIMAAAGLAYARPHDPVRVTPIVLACTLSMLIMGIVLSSNVFILLVGFVVALGTTRVVQRLRNPRTSD